jgi:hypothetical protein
MGAFRVLVLGGGVVFGRDVPLEETFAKRLESYMNSTAASPSGGCRVVNGSAWGLSTPEQWAFFEKLSPRLKPDLVVWVTGDGGVRRPLEARWKAFAKWSAWVGACGERSRLAGLLEMLYLYEWGMDKSSSAGKFSERITRFAAGHPETSLVLLTLAKDPALDGLKEGKNVLRFEIDKITGPDLSWKGLTRGGHKRLAAAVYPVLMKNIPQLMHRTAPAPAVAAPPSPQPKPAPAKKPAARRRR